MRNCIVMVYWLIKYKKISSGDDLSNIDTIMLLLQNKCLSKQLLWF